MIYKQTNQNKNYKGNTCLVCVKEVSIGSKSGFCRKHIIKRKMRDTTKEKIRLSKLGELNPQFGKKISESVKEKISKALLGDKNAQWKGHNVSYSGLHHLVYRKLGKPKKCEHCGIDCGRIEWANKSKEYIRDVSDWLQLCKKCHLKYDDVTSRSWKTKKSYAVTRCPKTNS